jgi:hypothetical protein
MTVFCPFFRGECKGHECMMFRNEECLFVTFLQESPHEDLEPQVIMESSRFELNEVEVPDWLEENTAEEIAEDIVEFKNRRFPNEFLDIYTISNIYWKEKGVDQNHLPSEIRTKTYDATSFAQSIVRKEKERMDAEKIEKEHAQLPSFVSQCIDWARENGLEKLTIKDVEAYVSERRLDITPATRRLIYLKTNNELKRSI